MMKHSKVFTRIYKFPQFHKIKTITIVMYSALLNIKREGTRKENYNKHKNLQTMKVTYFLIHKISVKEQ